MPEYDFYCKECSNLKTYTLGMDEERPTICEHEYDYVIGAENGRTMTATRECGGPLIRVWKATRVIYRAGGFNTTDKRLEPEESDFDE